MISRRWAAVIGLGIFCACGAAQETVWTPVDPGGNGGVTFTSINPVTGHAYTSSDMSRSLFRSTDQMKTWEPIANPVTGTADYVAADPSAPSTLYMCQRGATKQGSGIWKSTDDGDTWTQISNDPRFGGRNRSGLVDPENGKILYWTGASRGVLRSTDGGKTWNDWSKDLPTGEITNSVAFAHYIKFDPNSSLKNRRLFYPTNLGLFQATEPDGQWSLVDGLPKAICSDIAACKDGIVYAALPRTGLFKSADGGKTWKALTNGLARGSIERVVATKDRPDRVYVAATGVIDNEAKPDFGTDGIYGSKDGGESFQLLSHARFDADYNWPINYRQAEGVMARELFIDPHDPLTVYVVRGMKTNDGGKTWYYYGMNEVRQDRWKGMGLPLLTEYRAIFDPHNRNKVWLGFSDTGLMLSDDGGDTVDNVPTFQRAEVNQGAYWRDKLVHSSGSSYTAAVDPDMTSTVYACINGKNMALGGIVIKTVNGGYDWEAITEKNGLADGAVCSIVIDPSSPVRNRTVYVASTTNGVYKSTDDGKTFRNIGPGEQLTGGNLRLMWLAMAPSDPQTLYLAIAGSDGIRPISESKMTGYPALREGMYGGVYKTSDAGKTWSKCNSTREIPSVQQVAVHPLNPNIVYAAAYSERSLVPANSAHPEWKDGGVFKSADGGKTWEKVLASPNDELNGMGDVDSVCINPVCPEIVYAVAENFGAYRSMDDGKTWESVGKASMDRRQRRFFSIQLNPHDPAEVWVAHFGTSFSKGIDYKARKYMEEKFSGANFVANPGFEMVGRDDLPLFWSVEQPPAPEGEQPVFSSSKMQVKNGAYAARFHLTEAYRQVSSTIQADNTPGRPSAAINATQQDGDGNGSRAGAVAGGAGRRGAGTAARGGGGGENGETHTWIGQTIHPYFATLMRGKRVAVEMDMFVAEGNPAGPRVFLSEARDYNVHWVDAETYLEDVQPIVKLPLSEMKGHWYHVKSIGKVTEGAQWLRISVTGVGSKSKPMDAYVDNIRLSLAE